MPERCLSRKAGIVRCCLISYMDSVFQSVRWRAKFVKRRYFCAKIVDVKVCEIYPAGLEKQV